MMLMRKTSVVALIGVLALGACSSNSGSGGEDVTVQATQAVFGAIRSRVARTNEPPVSVVVTREVLDATPGAVLQAQQVDLPAPDFLQLVAERRDSNPGKIEVWKSSDDAQLILREGVLVGTKGLGGDLRSAEAATTFAGFDGQGGGGQRRMVLARNDGIAETVPFSCDMTQLGRESITIVDRRISTFRMREDCVFDDVTITNEYWVETGSGQMRKSRQWAGPVFGYVDLTRLK